MTTTRLRRLHDLGVSVWLDDLSRPLLEGGALARLVAEHGLSGVTSNPSIFAAALRGSDRYEPQLQDLLAAGVREPQALFFALALRDVRDAADLLRATYDRSDGRDGFVSFQCTPDVAHDARATVEQAEWVWARVGAPNLMVKVAATGAGAAAVEELTAAGINVNVTLLFGVDRYEECARAFQRGLARRAASGLPIDRVRSVASVFVARMDARVAELLGRDAPPGSVAVANAWLIHQRAVAMFDGARWQHLRARGAAPQRPLWASTAPKIPQLADVAYLQALALPDTIITAPERTLLAFADHGVPVLAAVDEEAARERLGALAGRGIDLDGIVTDLEVAGLRAFQAAYDEVLERLAARVAAAARSPSPAAR